MNVFLKKPEKSTDKRPKKKDPATSYVRRGKPNYLRRGSA